MKLKKLVTAVVLFWILYLFSECNTAFSQNNYTLGGQVFAGEALLDKGKAVIYKNDGQNFAALDTSCIDTLGYYYFTGINAGDYIIKVIPSVNSLYFNKYAPSYYGNVVQWESASLVIPSGNIYNLDINMVKKKILSGTGSISGSVVDSWTGSPCKDACVMLLNESGEVCDVVYSSLSSGNFAFNNLPFVKYILKVELTGKMFNVVEVILTSLNPDASNIILQAGGYSGVDNIYENSGIKAGSVFPNPLVSSEANIIINSLFKTKGMLTVFSVKGEVVKNENISIANGSNFLSFDLPEDIKGTFVLIFKFPNGNNIIRRIIKL